ncbi:MAG: MATE family efflux transporter [bacterium]
MAVTPMVAQLKGSQKDHRISKVVADALQLSLVFALPLILLLHLLEPLMEFIGYPEEVSRIGDGYLQAVAWGVPAMLAYDVFRHFNEGVALTRPNMYFHIVGLMLNILGNYTLMFGHFGFPAMGAVGAGWSTALVWNIMFRHDDPFQFQKFKAPEIFEAWGFFPDSSPEHP